MIFQFRTNDKMLWFYVYCAEKINNGKPKTELHPMDCQIQITSHIFLPFSWVWYTKYCNSMPTYSLYCLRIYPYLESFHVLSGKIQHASHNENYVVWLFDIELFFENCLSDGKSRTCANSLIYCCFIRIDAWFQCLPTRALRSKILFSVADSSQSLIFYRWWGQFTGFT